MGQSTVIWRDIRGDFIFLFHFSMKFPLANSVATDGKPRSAASHLGLYYLNMSHQKDARLICIKTDPVSNVT